MASKISYVPKKCLLCDGKAPVEELYPQTFSDGDLTPGVFSARRVTEHYHYRTVQCQGCGLVFASDILPEDVLLDLYSQSEFTFGDHTESLQRDYLRPMKPFLKNLTSGSALEIGCSSGFFLEKLQEVGFQRVRGVEPSEQAREAARKDLQENIHLGFFDENVDLAGERFDWICSFHTLDHVTDPLNLLNRCRDFLNPGGKVYFVTHDVDSLQAKVFGEKSPIIDVEHIYLFSQETIAALLEKAGFRPLDVGSLKNSYPLSYWAKMAPLTPPLKKPLNSLLNATGLGKWSPAISAGNLFAIAEKLP